MISPKSVAELAGLLSDPDAINDLAIEDARLLLLQVASLGFALAVRVAATPTPGPGGAEASRNGARAKGRA